MKNNKGILISLILLILCIGTVYAVKTIVNVNKGGKSSNEVSTPKVETDKDSNNKNSNVTTEKSWGSKEETATIIEFVSDTCPYCEKMKPIIKDIVENEFKGKLNLKIVNVSNIDSDEEVEELVIRYKIMGVPSLAFQNSKGEDLNVKFSSEDSSVLVGVLTKDQLMDTIKKYVLK